MYLTQGLPGIGGRLRERPEDFVVDEVARFEPEGRGPYLTLRLEKQGLSTPRALAGDPAPGMRDRPSWSGSDVHRLTSIMNTP